MKHIMIASKCCIAAIFCLALTASCKKNINDGKDDPGNPSSADSLSLDSLSNRLVFLQATKIPGKIPEGAAASSLKTSFKDTLLLYDQVETPIKFLHMDTTQNIAGVFLQVMALDGGSFSSYYYDVPEIRDSSDTVSVIMAGFDPSHLDFKFPISFKIKITPYNHDHKLITTAEDPVLIPPHNKGTCSLVLPDDEFWLWDATFSPKLTPAGFLNLPGLVWGAGGQEIQGFCCSGATSYPNPCIPGDLATGAIKKHFATYYQIWSETLIFHNDGTFARQTIEDGADPFPAATDFCSSGSEGQVLHNLRITKYDGNYTVTPATLPPDLQRFKLFKDNDSLNLRLNTTSTEPHGGGYGNGGGIIHQLDCIHGNLVLIQVDLEGLGQHLFKFYHSSKTRNPVWYDLK